MDSVKLFNQTSRSIDLVNIIILCLESIYESAWLYITGHVLYWGVLVKPLFSSLNEDFGRQGPHSET